MVFRGAWLWIPVALMLTAAIPCQALRADTATQQGSEWLVALNAHALCTTTGLQAGAFPPPAAPPSAGVWVAFSTLPTISCPHCLAQSLLALLLLGMAASAVRGLVGRYEPARID